MCGWSRRGGCAGGGGRAERGAWAGARLIASLWRTISPRGNQRDPAAATHSRRTGCNAPATSHSTFLVGAMLLLVLPAWLVAAQAPARASSSSPIAADAALASLDSGLAAARAYIHLRHLTEGRAPSPISDSTDAARGLADAGRGGGGSGGKGRGQPDAAAAMKPAAAAATRLGATGGAGGFLTRSKPSTSTSTSTSTSGAGSDGTEASPPPHRRRRRRHRRLHRTPRRAGTPRAPRRLRRRRRRRRHLRRRAWGRTTGPPSAGPRHMGPP